jgi:PAS domain S-box-containing protein
MMDRRLSSPPPTKFEHTGERPAANSDDRRRYDDSVGMSAERLRSAVEAAEVGTWHVDLKTGLDTRDASMNRLLGLDPIPSTQPNDDFFSQVHEDDRARALALFEASIAGTGRYEVEMRIRRPSGEVRWVRDIGRIGRDPGGEPIYATGAMTDITELKQAQRAIAESASFYEQTIESVPVMTFTTKPDGACDYVSRQWVEFTGVPAESQHGDGWMSVVHPEDRERALAVWQSAIRAGREYDLEYRVRRHDGEYAWFKVRGRAIRDESGKIARWIGSAANVNDLKQTEVALRESEERFHTLADNMSQLAWMADANGFLFWYNRRWFDFTGSTLEDMAGWGWTKLAHPDHVDRVVERIQRSWDTGEPWEDTFPLRRQDGCYRWFLSRAAPIRDEGGTVVRWFGTNTDVTEQRDAEEALRDADRRKDEFIATLAHELRNPLAPIRCGLDVLEHAQDATTRLHIVRTMDRQLAHMVRLVDDLLDVSRISRGQVELHRTKLTLRSVIDAAVETSRPVIEEGKHTLTVVMPEEPLWVDGDLTRLAQVVANLLNNAAKYTPQGGRIDVDVYAEEGDAVIRVSDTGVGIDAAALPRVFELFTRGPQHEGRAEGGLGIGLALVRDLLEMHGGTVTAESPGMGRGSTFEVRLPRTSPVRPVETRAAIAAPAEGRTHAKARNILVVDDNIDAAEMLASVLELRGHGTRLAHDGPDALVTAREIHPDVIFLDIGLPGMDGYEVARRLRADPAFALTLLVALTGWGSEDDKRLAYEAGFNVHLTKPVDADAVDAVVSRA